MQLDLATALISLVGHAFEMDAAISHLSAELGYTLLETPGHLELRPAWIVFTDIGIFAVDRQTGTITPHN